MWFNYSWSLFNEYKQSTIILKCNICPNISEQKDSYHKTGKKYADGKIINYTCNTFGIFKSKIGLFHFYF